MLHLLRNYSAFMVVVSSTVLVTATNVNSGKENSNGFLFGHWNQEADEKLLAESKQIYGQVSQSNHLAFTPIMKAPAAADTEIKEDEPEASFAGDESLVVGSFSPLKDPQEDEGVKVYEVQNGDTVSAIAASNGITVNTILWANDLANVDSIQPGDKLFILPVAGLKYVIKKGDDIEAICKKFKADKDRVIAFNDLPANGDIEEGQEIIIPDGRKEVPQTNTSVIPRRQYAELPGVSEGKKLDGKAGSGHSFPYGYCTWYVAQRRYVPWGGNAGTWLYHAKSLGYKTGKNPTVGSIMVSSESWWGHVAIVEKVGNGTITVSEMNYKGWAKKSSRVIPTSSRVIKGYIY